MEGFHVLNEGNIPKFEVFRGDRLFHGAFDVTACSSTLLDRAEVCQVVLDVRSLDHNAIAFNIRTEGRPDTRPCVVDPRGCSDGELEAENGIWDGVYRVIRDTGKNRECILLKDHSGRVCSPDESTVLLTNIYFPNDFGVHVQAFANDVNVEGQPATFVSVTGESNIDLTLTTRGIKISGWKVLLDASASNHQLIVYNVHGIAPCVARAEPVHEPCLRLGYASKCKISLLRQRMNAWEYIKVGKTRALAKGLAKI
ncbi:hypothetical protein EVAR_28539_1 [Eumeta japonica]|uniref:Uncharacterized protein n=1 Tax=Eumeta variegata TaxID=151549 RepID=A0A4C1UXC9_EUMVA|nr:hypothetical protein EVAR_28539_1 [Eumeta japonica]